MATADFLVIGGGVAGLSIAARLARHGEVVVLEAEEATGYHSSGRSATFSHYGIGDRVVRALTAWSRAHFPDDSARPAPALFFATEEMLPALGALEQAMARFAPSLETVDEQGLAHLCPILRTGGDGARAGLLDGQALKLDAHALLQHYARQIRAAGGELLTNRRAETIARHGGDWRVTSGKESWTAPVVVNAAGAWADAVAEQAGVRPLGLRPLRRTIIVLDAPAGVDTGGWPFTKSVIDDFYMLPEAGRLLASPVDEVESEPCDAQPEDYDVALAAWKVERYTTLPVGRIAHKWAGLRTFTADRVPVAGFAPDAPGFFWLAGQGGYGLQTAPAMARLGEALITGGAWPIAEIDTAAIKPDRLLNY